MDLAFYRLRFEFRAVEPVVFLPGLAANRLRGAFGLALRDSADADLYRRIFEPSASTGPSGLRDRPRPFVFRAAHLDGLSFAPGQRFHFDVNLFDTRDESVEAFRTAFARFRWAKLVHLTEPELVTVSLARGGSPIPEVQIDLVTPLELKPETLDFHVLFARSRDRISTIRALYGPGPLDIDFKAMGLLAQGVRPAASDLQRESGPERRSSRTGQVHALAGLRGWIRYAGDDLGVFVPYLQAAQFCGIGRQCSWGKGQILVTRCK